MVAQTRARVDLNFFKLNIKYLVLCLTILIILGIFDYF